MRISFVLLFAVILIFARTAPACCAEEQADIGDKPGVIMVDAATLTSTVHDIDKVNRVVTLKGPDGGLVQLKLGDEVKNFDQIEKGDKVVTEYYGSVAVEVHKGGVAPTSSGSSTVQVAPKGAKPGVITVDTTIVVAVVEDIDYTNRTITLRTPEGLETLTVSDEVKRFDEVKKGDNVWVKETKAIAISVRKP